MRRTRLEILLSVGFVLATAFAVGLYHGSRKPPNSIADSFALHNVVQCADCAAFAKGGDEIKEWTILRRSGKTIEEQGRWLCLDCWRSRK